MFFEYSPYLLPLLAAAVVSAAVAIYAWTRRSATGALALCLLAVSILVWVAGYSLEITGKELEAKYLGGAIQYLGIAFAPYSWLIFSIVYSRQEKRLTRRFLILAGLIPSMTVLLAFTTRWHGLIWSEYHIDRHGDFSALGVSHGVWFFVHFAYSYLMLLIGAILLVRVLLGRKGLYRGQVVAMLVAVLAPWAGNVLYFTGYSPIPYLDLTPFAFTITAVALAWAIFGFRLVDITPLARDSVIDSMREGMVVLDVRGNVVDLNAAAAQMIGVRVTEAIGKPAEEVFSPWAHLLERFRKGLEAKDEITVGEGEAKRRYEIHLSPLQDQLGQLVGRVILLRALGGDDLPQPRLAPRSAAASTPTRPLPSQVEENRTTESVSPKNHSIWQVLVDYYRAPVKKDLLIPPEVNPSWYQTRERLFTIILRLAATVGIVSLLFSAADLLSNTVAPFILFTVILVLLWILGLARNLKYEFRVTTFLLLIYSLGLVEMLNFGFSVESFTFFMTYAAVAAVLTSRRGTLHAFTLALVTMGGFAILIGSKSFRPLMTIGANGAIFPVSIQAGITSLLVFAASASAVLASVVILLENLNNVWQKETQALNLLQQERDLLEQRVEERTNELRKYFRAIEQSGNTIVITDTHGNIEYANPRFEQSTGYSVAEAKGSNPRVLKSGKQSAEYYRQMWSTIAGGNTWQGEFLNKRKDGMLYWESATIAPVLDQHGVITNYVAIKEDITARRQAEEQLRKLSQAVEQSGNTVIIMDKAGVIEYVNPKFTEVTGFSAEEALGHSPIALMNSLERLPDFSQDEWWLTVNAGRIWHGEFRNHRKDGSVFWESATIAPVLNRDGEVINFVEIKQDITQQKLLQDQLQKQNDYLSILHQTTLDLLNRRQLSDLLQVIVDRSAALLDAPYSELMLENNGALVVEAFTRNQADLKGDRVTRDQAKLSWQAFDTHQPVLLADYSTWEGRRELYDSLQLHATADFPVMVGERCLGVLALGRSQPDYTFTDGQIETGILFARLVALVLDNANLYDSAMQELAERKRAEAQNEAFLQDIKALQEIYLELSEADDLSELYIKMINLSQHRLGLGRIGLFVIDDTTGELQGTYGVGPDGQIRDESYYHEPVTADHWSLEIAAAHNHTKLWENAPIFDDGREVGRGWKSAAALWNGHRSIGYLVADNFLSHRPVRPYEEEIVSLLGSTFGHLIENKRNETRLLESEVRFRQIVENASDIIYRTDTDGNFIYFNPTGVVILGYQHETEVLGKNYLDLAVPEWRHKLKRFYRRQFIQKEKNTYFEFPAVRPNGEVIWLGQSVQIIEENNAVVGFQAVARDITRLVEAQEALALSRDEALDASLFKSQLLSRVSHELRTPLGGILGYAELLKYQMFGSLTEQQLTAVSNILESTNYLTHIVNDLLDEAQIESKSINLHNEFFRPADLLEKIKSTLGPLAEKKGLSFRAEIAPDLPGKLYGDIHRLQQIAINLTGNAVKFTKVGEVSVRIKHPDPAHWSLEVRDTGAGIPVHEQQNIFEPFRQVNNAITRENRGSGLGLAITRQLVDLMGGQISLSSEMEKGSLFTVTLPILKVQGE